MIEPFWRNLTLENVDLNAYISGNETCVNTCRHIDLYNAERQHKALKKTSDPTYFGIDSLLKAA